MTDQNPPGSAEPPRKSTRLQGQQKQQQEKTTGKQPVVVLEEEEDSGEDQTSLLRAEIDRLNAQVERLTREATLAQDRLIPTTESPPRTADQPAGQPVRFLSATPDLLRVKLSERTPPIDNLSDGQDPTFRQWQASIEDRLSINSDHYRSERARMALVWGHTTGIAKGYLEPQYLADSAENRFQTAEDMILLLKSYFVSGNEQAESRAAFHRLLMDKRETFTEFKARFISLAVKGSVSKSEWSFYLWEKITPTLRVPNLGFKYLWDNSFDKMVKHLAAYDMEKKNSPVGRDSDRRSTNVPTPLTKHRDKATRYFRPTTDGAETETLPTPPRASSSVPRLASKTPVPERQATPSDCYNCGKPGHFANDCPVPRVREIEAMPEEDVFEEAAEYYSDEDRTGNDDA